MVLVWLACVCTSGVYFDVDDVSVWLVGGVLLLLAVALGTQAKYYLAIHWQRLVWFPVSLVECVLVLVWSALVWLADFLVSFEWSPLASIWEDALATLKQTMKEFDCPDVFHVPPTITEMQAWRDMRCDQDQGQACYYQEGHMERMAIDTETYGPCRSMPCAVKEFDMARRGGCFRGPRKLNVLCPGDFTETLPYFLDALWWMQLVLSSPFYDSLVVSCYLGSLIPD
ncbi:unnamed protein product [Absidia cylindrospora]